MSVNDRPDDLMALPQLGESMMDKVAILKVRPNNCFAENYGDREAFRNRFLSELPAFLHHCLSLEIPEHLRDENSRFGVKAYHNPEILASMKELEPEMEILGIVEAAGIFTTASSEWEGTAGDLYKQLSEHRAIEIQRRLSGMCKSSIGL